MLKSRRTILAILVIAGLLAAPVSPAVSAPTAAAKLKLLWHVEFNGVKGGKADPRYFDYDLGDGGGFGNSEQEYYTAGKSNVAMDGAGHLVITAKKIPWSSSILDRCISCQFSSARLKTDGKIGFRYGRLEARMKMPTGLGTWPAFWMLGSDISVNSWPACGEIDILEAKGSAPTWAYGTAHGPGYSGGQGIGNVFMGSTPLANDYHTYAIEWTKNDIKWYVDNTMYHELTNLTTSPNTYVFNHEFFMILNLAMGGNFTGEIDPNLTSAKLSVDYIRYYSLNGAGKLIKH